MNILGIDVGSSTGIVLYNQKEEKIVLSMTVSVTDLVGFAQTILAIFEEYNIDVVVSAPSTRNMKVIIKHAKQLGVLELLSTNNEAVVVYPYESQAKSLVIGKGNVGKDGIAKHYVDVPDLKTEHECDAMMFIDWYLLSTAKD